MAFSRNFIGKFCLFSLICSVSIAVPVPEPIETEIPYTGPDIVKRTPGDSAATAIPATFDVTNWPNIAEEDCYAMLCLLNANTTFQRAQTNAAGKTAYRTSGAAYRPFQAANLGGRHTTQINSDTTSAEEFPWRSIQIPPTSPRFLFPATVAEQNSQGGTIGSSFIRSNIDYGDYFTVTFTGTLGTYCKALFSKPPDKSVCHKNLKEKLFGTAGVALANVAFVVSRTGKAPYGFRHAAGSSKGKVTKRSESLGILAGESSDDRLYF